MAPGYSVERMLMEVANRRATWGRWNLHAEAESLRLTPDYDRAVPAHYVEGEGNRFQPVDQIAYSSQDILDAEQHLLAHSQRADGPALTARLVARHTSRKIKGVRLDPDRPSPSPALPVPG